MQHWAVTQGVKCSGQTRGGPSAEGGIPKRHLHDWVLHHGQMEWLRSALRAQNFSFRKIDWIGRNRLPPLSCQWESERKKEKAKSASILECSISAKGFEKGGQHELCGSTHSVCLFTSDELLLLSAQWRKSRLEKRELRWVSGALLTLTPLWFSFRKLTVSLWLLKVWWVNVCILIYKCYKFVPFRDLKNLKHLPKTGN